MRAFHLIIPIMLLSFCFNIQAAEPMAMSELQPVRLIPWILGIAGAYWFGTGTYNRIHEETASHNCSYLFSIIDFYAHVISSFAGFAAFAVLGVGSQLIIDAKELRTTSTASPCAAPQP